MKGSNWIILELNENPGRFIDDKTIIVRGKIHEDSRRLSTILEKYKEWTTPRATNIEMGDKLQFMHFAKSYNNVQQSNLI